MITILSDVKADILLALGKYKFLTVNHFVKLGIVAHKNYAYECLQHLRALGYTDKTGFAFTSKIGKFPDIHFLTAKGSNLLQEHFETIADYPKSKNSLFVKDYLHRIATIDCQIAFEIRCKTKSYEVLNFDTYYKKHGSQRRKEHEEALKAQTQIDFLHGAGFIVPDAIGFFNTGEQKRLFCLEIHNGSQSIRAITQMGNHLKAIEEGVISQKYAHNKPNGVLFLFEKEQTMYAVLKKAQQNIKLVQASNFFLLKSIEQGIATFGNQRLMID